MENAQIFAVLPRRLTRAVAKSDDAVLTVTEFNVTLTAGTSKTLQLPEAQVAAGHLYTVNAASATHTVSTSAANFTPNNMLTGAADLGVSIDLDDTEAAVFLSLGNFWFVLVHSATS